jgi:hypothetical protein
MRERNGLWINGRGSGWFGRTSDQRAMPFGYHSQYSGALVDKRPPVAERLRAPARWQRWLRGLLRRGRP